MSSSLPVSQPTLVLNQVCFSRKTTEKAQALSWSFLSNRQSGQQQQSYELTQLSAQALSGELVALLGSSGIGKTSLLRLILGFEQLTAGQIYWQDQLLQSSEYTLKPEQRNFAYVAQTALLFPHLTVLDNVCFGLVALSEAERIERAEQALRLLEIDDLKNVWPKQLSGGQKKRVALARALVLKSALVLLDEPFSDLDAELKTSVQERLFAQFKENKSTVIWSTHHVDDALAYADRLWIIDSPQCLIEGSPQNLYDHPPNASIARRLGDLDCVALSELIACDPSWLAVIKNHQNSPDDLQIGVRPHYWAIEKSSDLKGINENLQLSVKVLECTKKRQWQSLNLQIIPTLEMDRQQELSSKAQLEKNSHLSLNAANLSSSKLRLDLLNSRQIRMTLASHVPILIGQTLRLHYLGEALTFEL